MPTSAACIAPATTPAPSAAATPVAKPETAQPAAKAETAQPAAGEEAATDPWQEGDEEIIDWGQETDLDGMVALAKDGQLATLQWHVLPNIFRLVLTDGSIRFVRNEWTGRDPIKVLAEAGVKAGKGGIPIEFSFCN